MRVRVFGSVHHLQCLLVSVAAGCAAPGQPHPDEAHAGGRPTDTLQTAASGAQVPEQPVIHPTATDSPATDTLDDQYLSFDSATNTVTFRLVAGPFAFNGFTSGGGTLTVPGGSTNVVNFEQADGTPHSAEIATGTGPIPNSGGEPAIPRAYTNKVVEGMVQGSTDVMRFTAPDSGTYRIICGVPGHALSGMWIWYKVDPSAKTPSFGPTPK
jgi:sulfocyanin SoxE-like protein